MFRSKKEHLCLICDIGSASVSAGLTLFSEGKKPKVVATAVFPISIGPKPDIKDLESRVLGFFEKACFWVSHEGMAMAHAGGVAQKKIEYVYIVLASPWYVSKTSKVAIEKNKPFELDDDLIQNAVKSEEEKFEQEVLSGKYEAIKDKDIKMIEREVVAVKLNGYETLNPHNKKATHAEFSFFMSVAPMNIITEMSKIAKKFFHVEDVFFRTFPLCFFGAMKKIYPHESDFILIDVAGESTDIVLVSKNTVEHSASFFSGRNNVLRLVMDKMGVTEEIANSFFKMNQAGTIEPTLKKEIEDLVSQDSTSWTSSVDNVLFSIYKVGSFVPTACFMVCDQKVAHLFKERMRELAKKYGVTNVVTVTSTNALEYVDVGKGVKQDEFLMIEALFFERHKISLHK